MVFKVTWSAAILLIIVISFQAMFTTKARDLRSKAVQTKYGVLMDAGSSGTRVKIYKYVKGQHSPIEYSDVQQLKVPAPSKRKPGLKELADSLDQVESYLKVLVDNAKKVVPAGQQAVTPIMLFATAGMRLLPQNKQKAIFHEVDRLLSDRSFSPFLYKKGNARVITGEEEAVFAWITVNFLKGSFSHKLNTNTTGALELGGASSQNAYRVSHCNTGTPTLTIRLAGKTYPLYAHSYLGYGINSATKSYISLLVKPGSSLLKSPCHNDNFTQKLTIENKVYTLQGKYDKAECRLLLKEKFFCDDSEKKCPMINQPRLEGRFYGISVLYYVMKDVGAVTNHGQTVSLPQFELSTRALCRKPAAQLDTKLYDVYNLCFRLNYVYEMLKDGYHVDMDTFFMQVGREMKQFDLNWTLGAMLYKAKLL